MLSKCSLFFDKSLKYLGDETFHFENARLLCAKLVELVQDVSVLGEATLEYARCKMDEFTHPGVVFPDEWCRDIVGASKKVYRLECVFQFLVESDNDEEVGHRVHYRRMCLRVRFFLKNERKPFHEEDFMFSRYDGSFIGD